MHGGIDVNQTTNSISLREENNCLISSIPNILRKVLAAYLKTRCIINQIWNTKLGELKLG